MRCDTYLKVIYYRLLLGMSASDVTALKRAYALVCPNICTGAATQGPEGPPGPEGPEGPPGEGTIGYYGSFYDTTTQTTTTSKAMTFNTTDISNGVSIASGSRITVANDGVYNIQFSAQLTKTQTGNQSTIYIWLAKNGTTIPQTNTDVTIDNQGQRVVAAWNFIVDLNAGDYVELYWFNIRSGGGGVHDISLLAQTARTVDGQIIPETPSIILTVQQVTYLQNRLASVNYIGDGTASYTLNVTAADFGKYFILKSSATNTSLTINTPLTWNSAQAGSYFYLKNISGTNTTVNHTINGAGSTAINSLNVNNTNSILYAPGATNNTPYVLCYWTGTDLFMV